MWATTAFTVAQIAQGLIEWRLRVGERSTLLDLLPIVHADNPGATLGLLASRGSILFGLNVAAAAILLVWVARAGRRSPLLSASVGLITGGGAANLADRLVSAHVTDYLALPYAPVFNLADVFILAGGLMLLSLAVRTRPEIS